LRLFWHIDGAPVAHYATSLVVLPSFPLRDCMSAGTSTGESLHAVADRSPPRSFWMPFFYDRGLVLSPPFLRSSHGRLLPPPVGSRWPRKLGFSFSHPPSLTLSFRLFFRTGRLWSVAVSRVPPPERLCSERWFASSRRNVFNLSCDDTPSIASRMHCGPPDLVLAFFECRASLFL